MASTNLARGIPQITGDVPAFLDFAPDRDPVIPGVITDMDNLYPTVAGYRTYPGPVKLSSNTLPSTALGAFAGFIGSTAFLVVGVSGQLYLLLNGVLTSQALSISTTTGRWRFDLYGDTLIAVDGVNYPLAYSGSNFNPLGGSPPRSSIVQASDYSVFLIETDSSIWHSSLSATIWTNSIQTQTISASLDSTPGIITAAHRLRGGMALYKRKSLVYSTFQGPPLYWQFNTVSEEIGAPSQEAVANIGDVHLFPGPNDFYMFDGYSFNAIPNNLRQWFFATLDQNNDQNIASRWDQLRNLVFWYFPSVNASPVGSLDTWICYNLKTGKWSKGSSPGGYIEIPIFATVKTGQLTYGSLASTFLTYGDLTGLYGDINARTVDISGIFQNDHALYIFNGMPGESYITTHDLADRDNFYECMRVRPYFVIAPSSARLQAYNQIDPGTEPTLGASANLYKGRFNFRNNSRLQRFKITAEDEMEIVGFKALIEFSGEQ